MRTTYIRERNGRPDERVDLYLAEDDPRTLVNMGLGRLSLRRGSR